MAALLNYIPDPVRIVVEKNEVGEYSSQVFLLLSFYFLCQFDFCFIVHYSNTQIAFSINCALSKLQLINFTFCDLY